MNCTSTEVYEAVQVIPENYARLDEWGVDYTSPTMEIPGKWVVKATPDRIVAILSTEDFNAQYKMVDSAEDTDGETNDV